MASFNVPNPYQVGTVLNSDRYTNFYFLQQSRQKAKEEAFDGYLNDLQKSATPAGMRTQDVPNFTEKAKEWKDFGIQKRREIQNPALDGGQARSEFLGRHQDLLGYTAASKGTLEKAKMLERVKSDPKLMRLVTDEDIADWSLNDLPLSDPRHKPLRDIINFKEEPFSQQEVSEYTKSLIGTVPPKQLYKGTRPDPTNPAKEIQTYEYNFDKKGIADRAIIAFKTNDRVRNEVVKLADEILPQPNKYNPTQLDASPQFDVFNAPFKQLTGRDMKTDEDVSVAYALVLTNQKSVEEKSVESDAYKRRMDAIESDRRANRDNANTRANIRLRKSLGGSEEEKDELINDVYSEISELARDNPYIRPQIMSPQAQKIVMDFAEVGAGRKLSADNIKVVDPGNGQLQVFQSKKDKDVLIGTLSAKSVNLKGQPSVKEKRAVIGQQPKPKTKNATVNVPSFLRK